RRGQGGTLGQPVPVWRLRADLRGGGRRGRYPRMTMEPGGASERRAGGAARVTGDQQFIADIRLDRMLHVKLVHLDCGHARIVSVDKTAAEAGCDVVGVFTAADP